jgi:hypothetical protein
MIILAAVLLVASIVGLIGAVIIGAPAPVHPNTAHLALTAWAAASSPGRPSACVC